ncbi:hypothetical protein LZU85_02245 [Vibrio sp. IRLE0018]|uniref:hypothetical protein n=1 Tax=Vibrio floridensis TaxID=2908007 RepID=UPI001A276337|nr:hypothetical protein [Vibrio floridensis]MCF8777608.1 hypothetical protein [Vibrio floridensis]HAS8547046.1 hypothetical protein [Vibrio vulnificus]
MRVTQFSLNRTEEVVALEKRVWGAQGATKELVLSRFETFPRGSVIALDDKDRVVGYAAVQKVSHICADSWYQQTDNGLSIKTHLSNGHILYGIGMAGEQCGVGSSMIEYVYSAFIQTGECALLALGSRVPGYRNWFNKTGESVRSYIQQKRSDGFSIDPELFLYQKNGFEILYEISEYFDCDKSLNNGVMIIKM